MLTQPNFIPTDLATFSLDYKWNHTIAVSMGDYDEQPERLVNAIHVLNYKAKAALALICLEWVLWRLNGKTDISDAMARVEAAWASTIDVAYSRELDFNDIRNDVVRKGNPDGLRQSMLIRLDNLHFYFVGSSSKLELEATNCVKLAQYVVPASAGFEPWLQQTLAAMFKAFPRSVTVHPSAEAYDHSNELPIPRSWFESLAVPPNPVEDRASWNDFLGKLDVLANPYLVPASEMLANGFSREPYKLA